MRALTALAVAGSLALALLTVHAPSLSAQTRPSGAMTPAIAAVLSSIRAVDKGQLAISEEDGRFLRMLVAARGAKTILEIGGASGYSGIWLGLGARETGGRVVTIEYDPQRAREAAANIARAGLNDVVRVVPGDAFAEIPRLTGGFDFVFLDAWKPDYQKFFDLVFPRLNPGGVFTAHNVINKKQDMTPFLRTIESHPGLFTTIVSPGLEGISVSYKTK